MNRTAPAWLIHRFIDRDATFEFIEPDRVTSVEPETGAMGPDAPGVRDPHTDPQGRCSFDALVDQCCSSDMALTGLALIMKSVELRR